MTKSTHAGRVGLGHGAAAAMLALCCACALLIKVDGPPAREVAGFAGWTSGMQWIAWEVLCSLPSRDQSPFVILLAVALWRPLYTCYIEPTGDGGCRGSKGSVALACFAALVLVWGRSFDKTGSAELVVGGVTHVIRSVLYGAAWAVVLNIAFARGAAKLDQWAERPVRHGGAAGARTEERDSTQTEEPAITRTRLRARLRRVFERHPVAAPTCLIAGGWMPALIGYAPGLFMLDTAVQILQWFGLPNHISTSVKLLDPAVLITQHHPPVHTALLGLCVQAGQAWLGGESAGALLYTGIQVSLLLGACAAGMRALHRVGAPSRALAAIAVTLAVIPAFSTYAVLMTKDVLFAAALLVMMSEVLVCIWSKSTCRAESPNRLDAVLLVTGAVGASVLRSGAWAIVTVSLVVSLMALRRRAKGGGRARRAWPSLLVGALAAVIVVNVVLTGIVYPALSIAPASAREMLSIPFQQVARVLRDHPEAVSAQDAVAIDRVLDVRTIAARYTPSKSDPVKATFRADADAEDFAAFFHAWLRLLAREPGDCATALAANYYGYLYPPHTTSWSYTASSSAAAMTEGDGGAVVESSSLTPYFSFEPADNPVSVAFRQFCTGYRALFQRIPALTLTMQAALYVWGLIVLTAYLAHRRCWRVMAVLAPLWLVLAMALIGPCNATTYFRYAYPIALLLPFALCGCWQVVRVEAERGCRARNE